jgi:peptidyl-tRNA hydrolase, PTH1 family
MPIIKLIVGLGNPGKKYIKTRHNAGFNVLDLLADKWGVSWKNWKSLAEVSARNTGEKVILVKPSQFMNNSGSAARGILDYYGYAPDEMLVVSDDFSLELGTLRLRLKGSSGGHNGLESIISETGTSSFPRLRLGIGPVPARMDPADFVLSDFSVSYMGAVNEMLQNAAEVVEQVLLLGMEKAASKIPVKAKEK